MENVRVIRSKRKSIAVTVNRELEIIVRAPLYTPEREIASVLASLRPQIAAMLEKRRAESAAPRLSQEALSALRKQALPVFLSRVNHYLPLLGEECRAVSVGAQRSRWGSCSAKGKLRFNCLLLLAPPEVLDGVVVHELCHLKEMNHSPRFYALVHSLYPAYDAAHDWLRQNGGKLIARLP